MVTCMLGGYCMVTCMLGGYCMVERALESVHWALQVHAC